MDGAVAALERAAGATASHLRDSGLAIGGALTLEPAGVGYGVHLRPSRWSDLDTLAPALRRGGATGVAPVKAGLLVAERPAGGGDRSDRKVYALTPSGQERVAEWIAEVRWPRPDLAEFHLKLVAATAAGLADPLTIVDTQRRELLRRLRDAQRAAMDEPDASDAALLLEGIVLRLQADLRWLEACEKRFAHRRSGS